MTVATEREPGTVVGARELGLPEPNLRSIFLAGAPRFARELFGPVLGFYAGYELWGLTAGIVIATVVALAIEAYERKHGRRGALALVSAAFVVLQGVVGLIADSAVVYLAQPVIVSAVWGVAYLVSAAIGRPLIGVFADAWYPFPDSVKASRTYRRIFSFESVVWGVYLLARSGLRMLVLSRAASSLRRDPVRDRRSAGDRTRALVALVLRARLRAKHGVGRRAAAGSRA